MEDVPNKNFTFGAEQLEDRPRRISRVISEIFDWDYESDELLHTNVYLGMTHYKIRKDIGRHIGGVNRTFCLLISFGYARLYREFGNFLGERLSKGSQLIEEFMFYDDIREIELVHGERRLPFREIPLRKSRRVDLYIPLELYGMITGMSVDLDLEKSSLIRMLFIIGFDSLDEVDGFESIKNNISSRRCDYCSKWSDRYIRVVRGYIDKIVNKVESLYNVYKDELDDDLVEMLEEYIEKYC